ncbi:NIPSNAP family containing protein [Hwanghaeella grinnelliae]|uniref:NIPSNAP family containing protein n=1 Tax=Hwanghaeella grinnelliae TaxID=2500179 RepID=A0A437QI97_9PROT|nr:NIPSNAP family protein [Hwanghaeella grinnelliae]RVU34154.1 NIPSNAP family containing protein [Hwanghaeella grinnelliae]
MAFYELRTYEIRPGKIDEWIELMEKEIIPMQVARGMVIAGSFRVENNDGLYIWIRRFEDEEHRKALYAAVYESDEWKNNLSDRVGACINRETIKVERIIPTAASVLK